MPVGPVEFIPGVADPEDGVVVPMNFRVCPSPDEFRYGGGGIIPDTLVERPLPSVPLRRLLLKDVFFKFANIEYSKLEKKRSVKFDSLFVVSDKTMKNFRTFLDSIEFEFSSYAKTDFDAFKKKVGLDTSDTNEQDTDNEMTWTEEELGRLRELSSSIETLLTAEGEREFENARDEIKTYIKDALLVRAKGQDNDEVFRVRLARDEQVRAAIDLLSDQNAYKALLAP